MEHRCNTTRVGQFAIRSAAVATMSLLVVGSASAQSAILYGTYRDFQSSHPDFGITGILQSAGNVALAGDAWGDPVYTGNGFVVADQWREVNGAPIAPHMFDDNADAVRLVGAPNYTQSPTVDSYDPEVGAYDPDTNVGYPPVVITGATMPTMPLPPNVGPNIGNVLFAAGSGTTTVNTSFLCDNMTLAANHIVLIDGNLTINVQDTVSIGMFAQLELLPGATLTLYVGQHLIFGQNIGLNANTRDHSLLTIYYYGTDTIALLNDTQVYASIIAPSAMFELRNNADFHGQLTAFDLSAANFSGLHISGVFPPPCHTLLDSEGTAGGPDFGVVSSAQTFSQWFKTIPGLNTATVQSMFLQSDGTGALMYETPDFTPLDNRLYGNEGGAHNRYFTMEVGASFTHRICQDAFFEFEGDGEVWLYIDGDLVIDLAGPQRGGRQYIDFDRLALVDGRRYSFRLYYAQRMDGASPLRIRTNIDLEVDAGSLSTMAMHD